MTNQEMKKRFDEKFKGWILQDDQEHYRSFEIITAFTQSEIDLALVNKEKDLLKEFEKVVFGDGTAEQRLCCVYNWVINKSKDLIKKHD